MKAFEIVIAPAAQREIRKLARRDQEIALEAIQSLSQNPRPSGMEKIQGHPKFYRINAGRNHRVIYHIWNGDKIVILVVRDRKNAYRRLDDLDGKLATALNAIEQEAVELLRTSFG